MGQFLRLLLLVALLALSTSVVLADQEASNVAAVFTGPSGRCYAKSVPDHIYDPGSGPRQQGRTDVYRVGNDRDELVDSYNWYSWQVYLLCRADHLYVIRIGPWHRGRNPQADHLAIAFYLGGDLIKRYSTLDISGPDKTEAGWPSAYKNASASVSHYTVFTVLPKLVKNVSVEGAVYSESWDITATTIDGRDLIFDPMTGELR